VSRAAFAAWKREARAVARRGGTPQESGESWLVGGSRGTLGVARRKAVGGAHLPLTPYLGGRRTLRGWSFLPWGPFFVFFRFLRLPPSDSRPSVSLWALRALWFNRRSVSSICVHPCSSVDETCLSMAIRRLVVALYAYGRQRAGRMGLSAAVARLVSVAFKRGAAAAGGARVTGHASYAPVGSVSVCAVVQGAERLPRFARNGRAGSTAPNGGRFRW